MPQPTESSFFIPPQSLHCLSFPTPDWREIIPTLAPPEPQFRDMAFLRMTRAFDPDFYWEQNQDIRRDQRDPFEHYLYHGARENRRPHPQFHPAFYRKQAGIPPETNPLLHYLFHPEAASLKPHPYWNPEALPLPWVHPFEYQDLEGNLQPAPPVVLDFRTRDFHFDKGRYLVSLSLAILEAGRPLLIPRENKSCLPVNALRLLQQQPGVHEIPNTACLSGDWTLLSDRGQSTGNPKATRQVKILLDSGDSQKLQLPFPMHNSVLRSRSHRFLKVARERSRTMRIFFAGQNPRRYRFTPMAKTYGVLNRHKVLKAARGFLKDQCDLQVDHDRFIQERSPTAPPAVFIDSRRWRIIPQCWLDRLGYARFFLCPPGAVHPISHNLVEAMAVGTVPILEYGHLLNPALQDGINCLAFQGHRGLQEKLEEALQMPEEQWEKLHQNTLQYFDRHLDFSRIVQDLLNPLSPTEEVSLPFKP